MKYLFKVIAAACAMGLTAVSAQAETDLSFAVLINPPGPEFEALDFFVKRVEELSKGDLKISVFPGGQLGNTRENIEQLGVGQVALALHGDELISGLVPEYSAVITPFVFPSTEAVFDFWRSDAGKAAIAQIETRGGIRVIGIMRRGQLDRNLVHARRQTNAGNLHRGIRGVADGRDRRSGESLHHHRPSKAP